MKRCKITCLGQACQLWVCHFSWGKKDYNLLCKNKWIVVPTILTQKIIHWYHNLLCYPGGGCTEKTISQHFYWKGLQDDVHKHICTCSTSQITKPFSKKYRLFPAKRAEAKPWENLCVDLIGSYIISVPPSCTPQPYGSAQWLSLLFPGWKWKKFQLSWQM